MRHGFQEVSEAFQNISAAFQGLHGCSRELECIRGVQGDFKEFQECGRYGEFLGSSRGFQGSSGKIQVI